MDASASASSPAPAASLTYEPFYGLREKPFSLSPDPRFLFRSPAHGPAFDELLAGIRRREGLIVLTGEIGTGKTTLCRSVLEQLDRRTFSAFVADPFVSREDLLKTLLVDFGVISIGDLTRGRFSGASRSDLSYPLYEFLDSLVPLQALAVVVIDEAQNLSLPLLEEIRILSELERREKLLQVVLVGQPELRDSLKLPQMRQVEQRVTVRCELSAMDAGSVAGYVNHRLRVAGRGESELEFTAAALEAIHHGSAGVPRLVNRICERTLQRACASRSKQIDAPFVRAALEDLGLSVPVVIQTSAVREASGDPGLRPVTAAVQAPPAARPAPAAPSEQPEDGSAGLMAFATEETLARTASHRKRFAGIAASICAVSAILGAAGVYRPGTPVTAQDVAGLLPARPARPFSHPVITLPPVNQALLEPPPASSAVPASAAASAPTSVAASTGAPASAAVRAGSGAYTIMVAAFASLERADGVVEELANAGFGAHAVNVEAGASRSRLVQVKVSGYTSAIDVQRDLQQIRQLPGGYRDARIVEHD